jgi:hypothetical protein
MPNLPMLRLQTDPRAKGHVGDSLNGDMTPEVTQGRSHKGLFDTTVKIAETSYVSRRPVKVRE